MLGLHELEKHVQHNHEGWQSVYHCAFQQEPESCGYEFTSRESAIFHIYTDHFSADMDHIGSWSNREHPVFPNEPNLYVVHRDLIIMHRKIRIRLYESEDDLEYPEGKMTDS